MVKIGGWRDWEMYSSSPWPTMAPSKLNCQMTSKTWYRSCKPTPPLSPASVALRTLLPPPFHSVEPLSLAPPVAARNMSIKGFTVSSRCFQKSSLDFFVLRSAEYSWTAMSCKPLSWLLVRVDRYL